VRANDCFRPWLHVDVICIIQLWTLAYDNSRSILKQQVMEHKHVSNRVHFTLHTSHPNHGKSANFKLHKYWKDTLKGQWVLDGTSSSILTIKHRWCFRGDRASYVIVQYSPFCVWVTTACLGHMHTQRNSKVDENYYTQRKKMCSQRKLNPRPGLWY
jgi:hypothetical protein